MWNGSTVAAPASSSDSNNEETILIITFLQKRQRLSPEEEGGTHQHLCCWEHLWQHPWALENILSTFLESIRVTLLRWRARTFLPVKPLILSQFSLKKTRVTHWCVKTAPRFIRLYFSVLFGRPELPGYQSCCGGCPLLVIGGTSSLVYIL